jgi:glycine oxidase
VLLASGHHRSGILLAPITARMIADMVTGASPTVPLRPFSYRRH